MFPSEIIVVPTVFGIPAAVVLAFRTFRHREMMAKLAASPGPALSDARIARLEQALEAVAVEIERISEGQRFVTKLLAERTSSAVPVAPGNPHERPPISLTPH